MHTVRPVAPHRLREASVAAHAVLIHAVIGAIGRELRRMYDDVAQEPVPDDFMDLLRQIDESDERGSAEDKGGKKVS